MQRKSKFTVADNTVAAEGQMKNSSTVYYLGNPAAARRLLIVGNSITRHGPLAEIGWPHDWGMAASAPERDYVHLLTSRLFEKEDLFVMVRQLSEWERHYMDKGVPACYEAERAFAADEIVYRLGENVQPFADAEAKARFGAALEDLIAHLNPKGGRVYFTTCFWKSERVDSEIRRVAQKLQMPLLELGALGEDEENMAIGLFEHRGVAHHPGDLGMQRIAEGLYALMRK